MNIQVLEDQLKKHGIESFFEQLKPHFRPTIKLQVKRLPEDRIPIGASKVGGCPDVPVTGFEWPCFDEIVEHRSKGFLSIGKPATKTKTRRSLSFMVQVNCAEASRLDKESLLPKTGMLYFFYAYSLQPWGYDREDEKLFRVCYADTGDLHRASLPVDLAEDEKFTACQLIPKGSEVSYPGDGNGLYDTFDNDVACTFWNKVHNWGSKNKMLGWADNLQGEMEDQCGELLGVGGGDDGGANADSLKLLFQLDSDPAYDMRFGDNGMLYFWIPESNLTTKDFTRTWMVLQSL